VKVSSSEYLGWVLAYLLQL